MDELRQRILTALENNDGFIKSTDVEIIELFNEEDIGRINEVCSAMDEAEEITYYREGDGTVEITLLE